MQKRTSGSDSGEAYLSAATQDPVNPYHSKNWQIGTLGESVYFEITICGNSRNESQNHSFNFLFFFMSKSNILSPHLLPLSLLYATITTLSIVFVDHGPFLCYFLFMKGMMN